MSKTYKIADACRELDVQPYVLRYWETEFAALGGKKSGPQRVYSEAEIGILQQIKKLLYDEGYTIAGAKKRLDADGESANSAEPSEPTRKKAARSRRKTSSKPTKSQKPRAASEQPSSQELLPEAGEESSDSLDRAGSRSIESVRDELQRLHTEATQILALVRAAKGG